LPFPLLFCYLNLLAGLSESSLAFIRTKGAPSSRSKAARSWDTWVSFCESRPELNQGTLISGYALGVQREMAVQFIMHIHEEKGMDAGGMGCLLSGVKSETTIRGGDASIWDDRLVQMAKQACALTPEELRVRGRLLQEKRRLPATMEFLTVLRPRYWGDGKTGWSDKETTDRRMTYVGVAFGLDRITRTCSVSMAAKDSLDHSVRAEDMRFIYRGGLVLTLGQARRRPEGITGLEGISIVAYSSKGNKSGRREESIVGGTGEHAGQLLRDLWAFCMFGGGRENGLVFERRTQDSVKGLTSQMTGAAIKEAAAALGLDPAYFGNHSLRHAGAGIMVALEEEIRAIKARGGWAPTSNVMERVYARYAQQCAARGPLAAVDDAGPEKRARLVTVANLGTTVAIRNSRRR
jgi:hypothetical protein